MAALKTITVLITFLLALIATPAFAQFEGSSLDVGYTFEVADSEAEIGDILINTDKGLTRATEAYSNKLFGVIQKQPVLVFKTKNGSGKPIARTGLIEVNITTLNGSIAAGDYVTSSEVAGKGQKATVSGYVIGIAMGPLKEEGGQTLKVRDQQVVSGKIPVALRVEYAELTTARSTTRFLQQFNAALFQNVQNPDKFANIIKYIASGLTALLSFGFGFFTFSRSIPKGIEAIGRNPLAEKAILFSLILNIVMVIISAAVGVIGSLIILRM